MKILNSLSARAVHTPNPKSHPTFKLDAGIQVTRGWIWHILRLTYSALQRYIAVRRYTAL